LPNQQWAAITCNASIGPDLQLQAGEERHFSFVHHVKNMLAPEGPNVVHRIELGECFQGFFLEVS